MKLLVMLVVCLAVALALLGLRQRRLELTSQSAAIYQQIEERNQTLLDQRVAISLKTNPIAVKDALQATGVNPGPAFETRDTQIGRPASATPTVETDLVAPLIGGHDSPSRPRQ